MGSDGGVSGGVSRYLQIGVAHAAKGIEAEVTVAGFPDRRVDKSLAREALEPGAFQHRPSRDADGRIGDQRQGTL